MNKIVAVASGTRGDVQPAVSLLSYLGKMGYDVTICGGLNIQPLAEANNIPFIPMGEDCEEFVSRAPDPTKQPIKATKALADFVIKEMEIQFNNLPGIAINADLILAVTFGFAGATVAEALKKPFGYISYCPQLLQSNGHPALFVKSHRHSKTVNWLSWKFFKTMFNISYRDVINKNRKNLDLPPIKDCWEHVLGEKILLACDREYSTVPSDIKQKYYHTGYLPIPRYEALDDDLLQFVNSGSKPVYIGFGSMTAREPEKTTKIVIEASKIAKQRIVLSSGMANLGVDREVDQNCYVVGKSSHPILFPKMAAIVHHGGSGTTATAARAGVPQIIIPHMSDQFYFAEQIPKLGVAPESIWRKNLTSKNLSAAIDIAVSDEIMIKKCKALAEKLADHDSYVLAEKYIRADFLSSSRIDH
ncbi:MAG: glycosyltransferase family 1 protein [Deltaproteobacteria bacterium]|nr:glycosyltransferase family 1 protein [Deltaproteobacteria bacterium]MBW2634694.1 glycosyltransferase family 1 protein [Deltaproteobacteria bacterium]